MSLASSVADLQAAVAALQARFAAPVTAPPPVVQPSTGWPDATNTGVPVGVVLKTSGAVTVNTAGAVVQGLDVTGGITVNAPNVTIKNFKARSGSGNVIQNNSTGLVVQDGEIDGLGTADQAIGWSDYTALRLNIHSCGDGLRANGNVTVKASYIHALAESSGSHNDGIQITEGSNVVIDGNAIENANGETSCVMVGADQGAISNVQVTNNLLNGGGYALYGGAGGSHAIKAIVITGNRFGRKFYPKCGFYGPTNAIVDPNITASGNVWDDTGLPVS